MQILLDQINQQNTETRGDTFRNIADLSPTARNLHLSLLKTSFFRPNFLCWHCGLRYSGPAGRTRTFFQSVSQTAVGLGPEASESPASGWTASETARKAPLLKNYVEE